MNAKDWLIEKQAEEIKMFKEYIKVLEQKTQLLEEKIARLEKNSSNSSEPPLKLLSLTVTHDARVLSVFAA
ncbi:MAG: hypothetical protein ISS77_01760 [Phycisphaerae bacterium]|nr:hypothetical protein [Phycisphaerae bacterium]